MSSSREPNVRSSLLQSSHDLADQLALELPRFLEAILDCLDSMRVFARRFPVMHDSLSSHPSAFALIANQALNDFLDLCYDLVYLRGRSALREARVLFEHLINILDVIHDEQSAARYTDHIAIGYMLEVELQIGVDRLTGRSLKSQRHRLRKLSNDYAARAIQAVEKYGKQFRRSWHQGDLYSRAEAHGLAKEYKFYRFASMVLHGSASGATATVRVEERYRRPLHRLGPALTPCVFAYLYGIRFMRKIVEEVNSHTPVVGADDFLEALKRLDKMWLDYRQTVQQIDERLWPGEAPPGIITLFGLHRSGREQWFLHDSEVGLIVEAIRPTRPHFDSNQEAALRKQIAELPPREQWKQEWVTFALLGTDARRRPGKPWRSEAELFSSNQTA